MPGSILGIYGKQRSGKTCIAYKLAKGMRQISREAGQELRIYSNLYTPPQDGFVYVNCMDDLPLDLEPKVVLIDEIYNGCDAQDYRKLKDISIFINTLGKQNCLFLFTSIDPAMVYNRIRNQMNVVILVKGSPELITYRLIYLDTLKYYDYTVKKTPQFFRDVNYDSNFIPLDFNWSMGSWQEKLKIFYAENYGIRL